MRQKKRAAAVLLSAVMAFSAVSPAVPVWAASWQKNASGSYIGSDGSVLTGILSRGIDVSQWQQNINWSAVADDDIQFAMIGTRYNNAVDPYFDTNVRGAAAAGLRVGVYLYSYATTTAMAESDADFVLNLIKDYPISYPVVLDVEAQEMNGLTPSQIADIINAFCKKVETAGYYPMVYTNDYWISNKIDMTKVHYDVWIARYNSKPTYQGAALWQASNQGTVNGINGNVDINFTFKDLSSKLPANRWRLIGDKWYYYKNYVKQTGWINDGQSWYYLNADGTQFKGWLLLDNQVLLSSPDYRSDEDRLAEGGGCVVLLKLRRHDGEGLDPGRRNVLLSVERRDGDRLAADRKRLLLYARQRLYGDRLAEDGREVLLL